ncbi:MAG TPA: NGG1p interacting factor NIF3, partial [Thermodesulfobacteriota bacterium]
YERAIKRGMVLDPRGAEEAGRELESAKKEYDDLKERDRKWFDRERFRNPYSDSRILFGDPEKEIKRALVGIDMEVGEIVLADRLRDRGKGVDLIIAHHPEGSAMANLYEVMDMQSGILLKYGVPINVAESIMDERIREVERRLMPANHTRAVDAARLLDIPLMCLHTPADNAVADYLQRLFDESRPRLVSDIVKILKDIPEYVSSMGEVFMQPKAVVGSEKRSAGKIFVDMTGGTGGSKLAFERLAISGVGTIVGMHISEDHRKEASKHHINVVIAGHIASDSLGLNLLLDNILDGVEVIETSGFRRVART